MESNSIISFIAVALIVSLMLYVFYIGHIHMKQQRMEHDKKIEAFKKMIEEIDDLFDSFSKDK